LQRFELEHDAIAQAWRCDDRRGLELTGNHIGGAPEIVVHRRPHCSHIAHGTILSSALGVLGTYDPVA
jgi:hypothetical protein